MHPGRGVCTAPFSMLQYSWHGCSSICLSTIDELGVFPGQAPALVDDIAVDACEQVLVWTDVSIPLR